MRPLSDDDQLQGGWSSVETRAYTYFTSFIVGQQSGPAQALFLLGCGSRPETYAFR